jgi:ethanolamine permease
MSELKLKNTLSPLMVWGLGVGYVISGNYFGWNLGLKEGGTLGLAIATIAVIIMYTAFTFSYAELACAIPRAGGAFEYTTRAFGKDTGFITGMAQNIEFIFAPPAIAAGIGTYVNLVFPSIPITVISVAAYFIFTALNIYGIQAAARIELIVTIIAVAGLILFSSVALPEIKLSMLSANALPNGIVGVFAAIPFAIWFFLGIEGIANLAEEAVDPRKTMYRGFLSALFTLILLCCMTFMSSTGVAGWEKIVFLSNGKTNDAPLPMALEHLGYQSNTIYQLLILAGIFGLIASFHGLMLASGRSTYEFSKSGYGPGFLNKLSSRFNTPAVALIVNMCIGIFCLFSGKTGELITISVFGALTLYILSMAAVIRLRKKEPDLHRPFQVNPFPVVPVIALTIAIIALVALAWNNPVLGACFLVLMMGSFIIFKVRNTSTEK